MSQSNLNLSAKATGPVECLGQKFPSDEARREHFLKLLAQKLKDPEFRKIEGFPIGKDDDILALSDPPYYTACPNPWLADFVKGYGTPYDPKQPYHREPFAADVSEGKTHAIYTAHAYHTKVPHRAIMRYILHYTQPGDVVFDGFSGTGMTGVAAQFCGDRTEVHELGYRVQPDDSIVNEEGKVCSRLGARRAILDDLAPVASFIAANYNTPVNAVEFEKEAASLLEKVTDECGWMFETKHKDGRTGRINYTVWSEVFSCPECATEIVFVKEAFDRKAKEVLDEFDCPKCKATLSKDRLLLLYESRHDSIVGATVKVPKRVPAIINYTVGSHKFEKDPDETDLAILERISKLPLPKEIPNLALPDMQMARVGRMQPAAIKFIHQFFLPRAAHSLASLWRHAKATSNRNLRSALLFFVEQAIWTKSVLNRYRPSGFSQVNQFLSGVFYVPSQHSEPSPWYVLEGKADRLVKTFGLLKPQLGRSIITTQDCSSISIPNGSVDYIFTDPPFGENIYYSDLNILIESWHGVRTNPGKEAIVDKVKQKALKEYQQLMQKCFEEYFRILKPGRWITVEFSNSQAAVWNAIQTTLQEAGFVVANVAALDKQQRSFQSVTSPTAVKQDLVISAYKPNGGLEERFAKRGETEEGVWDFMRTHLKNLPVVKAKGGQLEFVAERDPR
ncbi:MAG TPA: DNA methyltransferase, partial [Verrucomicrobiota bacterium]|nr:DNA methyltransferase [Verrucomicrobiota bacterium]